MLCGLIQYTFGGKNLSPALLRPVRPSDPVAAARVDRQVRLVGLVTAGVLVVAIALVASGVVSPDVDAIASNFKWVLLGITVAFFAWLFLSGEWTADERKRLVVITVLFVAASVFWMAYEQAGSTLNLFAQRSVDNSVLGHAFPASLVPVAAGAVHHPLRAPVRGDLAPAGDPEPLEPGQVRHRPPVPRPSPSG